MSKYCQKQWMNSQLKPVAKLENQAEAECRSSLRRNSTLHKSGLCGHPKHSVSAGAIRQQGR